MNTVLKVIIFNTVVGLLFLTGCAKDSAKEDDATDKSNVQPQETVAPKESRPLSEVAKESELKEYECEDKFKNENGVCEVPNPEYPKELIDKKYKEKEEDKEDQSKTDGE